MLDVCQDAKAKRGCHAAKGFQHGTIARLASLRLGKRTAFVALKPRRVRGFLVEQQQHQMVIVRLGKSLRTRLAVRVRRRF